MARRRWTPGIALALPALMIAACELPPATDRTTAYYVDGRRPTGGDGKSWATAWERFADIDWAVLLPGDVVWISGGDDGLVYRETLAVATSGSERRPVTIRAASAAGHAGPVVIDAQNRRANGIVVEGRDHVTIRGLAVRNVGDAGVRIRDANAGVVVEQIAVSAGNPLGRGNARGFDVRDSRDVVLRQNSYTTPVRSTAQNDGIFSMRNDGVRYVGNRLVMRNGYEGPDEGHNDCIQSYLDHDIEIVGNYCEQRNAKTGHSLGIFVQNISGTALVADNVVLSPNTRSACIAVENLPDFPTTGRMLAHHNTAYGCAYGTLHIVRSPGSEAYNNILVSPGEGAQALKIVPPAPPRAALDFNLLFTPDSPSPVFVSGKGVQSWCDWRALGYEAHGIFGDPHFVDVAAGDLRLESTSIALGQAKDLGTGRVGPGSAELGAHARRSSSSADRTAPWVAAPQPTDQPANSSAISKRETG